MAAILLTLGSFQATTAPASAQKRMHRNVLAIALANKLARIAWAVLNKEHNFESPGQTR
jgi:hypothetical protein